MNLDPLSRSNQVDSRFIGRWQLGDIDGDLDLVLESTMTFRPDGQLLYVIPTADGQQIMRLTYRQQGDVLITDQASAPKEERTRFKFLNDDILVLDYNGSYAEFFRVDD